MLPLQTKGMGRTKRKLKMKVKRICIKTKEIYKICSMILELLTQSFRYFLINKLQIMSINKSCDKTSVSFIVKPRPDPSSKPRVQRYGANNIN